MLNGMTPPLAIRQPCPPGVCICEREQLLGEVGADLRILKLNRQAEKELLERLENVQSLMNSNTYAAVYKNSWGLS